MTAGPFPHADYNDDPGIKFMPTPTEIRAACRQIQSEWSADEELRRRAWSIPREPDYGRVTRLGG